MVLTEDGAQAEAARTTCAQEGAESLDAARDTWWVGLREAEAAAYTAQGGDFTQDEAVYRQGFEAALRPAFASKPYSEAVEALRTQYPDVYAHTAFRRGFERGQTYYGQLTYARLTQPREP
jgi:hypothetical protein